MGGRRVAAALGLVLLAACAGEPPPPRTVGRALPGSPPEVERALLTAADLGEGWRDEGATPLEDRGMPACPQTTALTAGEPEDRRGEAQSFFVQAGAEAGPVLFASVSLWASADAARRRTEEFASQTSVCRSFTHAFPDGRTARVTTEERPAPALGDESVAVRMAFAYGEGVGSELDVVAVRLGDAVVLTHVERVRDDDGEHGLDADRLEALTARAVARAERELGAG